MMSSVRSRPADSSQQQRLGRFELRRVLGQGAQAMVWLAWDPQLEREVAVKRLTLDGQTPSVISEWLNEARAVSRLTHPNVVPVFEAGEDGGQPYLVFEYVQGPTLLERLRAAPTVAGVSTAMPVKEAAGLMLGVLDGLAAAHEAGIVHRDLKPSNILLGADGRPRVMDFGIAARLTDGQGDGRVAGTPAYISPEAARGEAPQPTMDVFSAGMLFAHLLLGRHLLKETDPRRMLARIQSEAMALPEVPELSIDDGLRSIVQRALSRQPAQRWAHAGAMRDALQAWLHPDPQAQRDGGGGDDSTLDFLLRRMRHKSDFPALSDAVTRIQRVANSEDANLSALSDEIMKDVALTHKLLRLVNTAHFSHAAGGQVNTVSRAVALVGFAGIRNLALSLVFLEHMQDKGHAERLKDVFLRALMGATLATELCPLARFAEEAFLVSMLQNLGRMLTEFYFPEEALRIRQQAGPDPVAAAVADEDRAALDVLGITFEHLGLGVARAWGLSDALQKGMRRVQGAPPRNPPMGADALKWLGHMANEMTLVLLTVPPESHGQRMGELAENYSRVLNVTAKEVTAAAESARQHMTELVQWLAVRPGNSAVARRLLASTSPKAAESVHDLATLVQTVPGAMASVDGPITPIVNLETPSSSGTDTEVRDVLASGVQEVIASLAADQVKLDKVLQRILQILHSALGLQRVVLALRDPRGELVTGRMGVGLKVDVACQALRVPLKPAGGGSDLFSVICVKGSDLLIEDARAPNIATRLPQWYRRSIDAPTMLLLPLTLRQAPFGLIYADHAVAGGIRIGEPELALVKTLRNQAVMAFKTAGTV